MPSRVLERIQQLVREANYEVTDHAYDEMADDDLLLVDLETAILTGVITRQTTDDPRGTVYVLEGVGTDRQTPIGVAARFTARETLLIITAYKIQ